MTVRRGSDRRLGLSALFALSLPHFAITLATQAPGLVAPWMIEELGLTRAQLGLLTSARFIGSSGMFLVAGLVVARTGIPRGLALGLAMFGAGTATVAGLTGLVPLLVTFVAAGVGFALVHPATTDAVVQVFPPDRQGTVMGLKEASVPLAGVAATWLFPVIAVTSGWRPVFVLAGAFAVAAGLWASFSLRSQPLERPTGGERSRLRSSAFTRPVVGTGLLQLLLLALQFCLSSYLLLYLIESVGLRVPEAAVVVGATQVGSFVWRLALGVVTDRFFAGRYDVVVAIICLAIATTVLLLAQVTAETPFALVLVLGFMLGGASQGWVGTVLLYRSTFASPSASVSQVTAAGFAIGSWGPIVGPPLFGTVVDWTGSYDAAWIGSGTLFAMLGSGMLLASRRTVSPDRSPNTAR